MNIKNNININLFSGIQPSGIITIGNYIGVLNKWKYFQKYYNCYFCIADLHALSYNKNENIKNNILNLLSLIISLDIDPNKSTIFLQSKILEHTQLMWFIFCNINFIKLKILINLKIFIKMIKKI